jgi:hypothetical protein
LFDAALPIRRAASYPHPMNLSPYQQNQNNGDRDDNDGFADFETPVESQLPSGER